MSDTVPGVVMRDDIPLSVSFMKQAFEQKGGAEKQQCAVCQAHRLIMYDIYKNNKKGINC
jgi:hypothetical protein